MAHAHAAQVRAAWQPMAVRCPAHSAHVTTRSLARLLLAWACGWARHGTARRGSPLEHVEMEQSVGNAEQMGLVVIASQVHLPSD